MRDRRDAGLRRRHRDHRQRVIARSAENTKILQVSNVGVGRQMMVDNYRVDVAVIGHPI